MGARIPRGALLVGPPGTGKTLLAKACAGEANVAFFYLSGSEFVEGWVGVGAKKVRDLFEEAKNDTPSIIFIDEIDAIGKKRGQYSSGEVDNTLNQLLVEMDGFSTENDVVVFAATNIPESLDNALTRPGRFDRQIQLTLPEKKDREEILKVHLKKLELQDSIEEIASTMANLTPGFSGAKLANLCNEAAIQASRENSNYVQKTHFNKAIERIMGGLKNSSQKNKLLQKRMAVYECSKAIFSWYTESVGCVLKISLIPRSKKKQGYSQFITQNKKLQTKQDLIDKIAFNLSGKIGEEIMLNDTCSIGQEDLMSAYNTAQKMITKLGMTEEIGLTSLKDDDFKIYSEKKNEIIDKLILNITDEASDLVKKVLNQNKLKLDKLINILLEKESLDHFEILKILEEKPTGTNPDYDQFLKENTKK